MVRTSGSRQLIDGMIGIAPGAVAVSVHVGMMEVVLPLEGLPEKRSSPDSSSRYVSDSTPHASDCGTVHGAEQAAVSWTRRLETWPVRAIIST
ncbi:hypothetical protein [Plantactinospora soyae]|uniref:Uncharacterized protein n=1 Tax=Plantactinospora soyae TaxID=1544732 RepID=A0A927M557_9ACTN|nr:hypothetical protein [Plantactinospora soyae]MBE1488212.1 hypothetical protein [Plantactinospora soyae]